MSKNMNTVLNEKKEKNKMAREFYVFMKRNLDKNIIDLVKEKKMKPAQINSDMALFKTNLNNRSIIYYYNRMEVRQNGKTEVLPL